MKLIRLNFSPQVRGQTQSDLSCYISLKIATVLNNSTELHSCTNTHSIRRKYCQKSKFWQLLRRKKESYLFKSINSQMFIIWRKGIVSLCKLSITYSGSNQTVYERTKNCTAFHSGLILNYVGCRKSWKHAIIIPTLLFNTSISQYKSQPNWASIFSSLWQRQYWLPFYFLKFISLF